jgi:hypothetical protein
MTAIAWTIAAAEGLVRRDGMREGGDAGWTMATLS